MRELASGPPGSNRGVDAVCGLNLLSVLHSLTLRHFSSGSRCLEVMGARKNWAREGDTRVSHALPIPSCTPLLPTLS